MASTRFYLNHLGLACALGSGARQVAASLFAGDCSHMRAGSPWLPDFAGRLGVIGESLPALPPELAQHECRNNRLALAVARQIEQPLAALRERYGPRRIAVVMGTSTSGIAAGEEHLRGANSGTYSYRQQQQLAALAQFVAACFRVQGPQISVSTACSSSANAFASARRLLSMNICDAVVVGGVDTLCGMTVKGFHALGALSAGLAQPFSRNRDGINLGEAGAMFVLSREPGPVRLCGVGASSDAHHMSAPDPSGGGAAEAMRRALRAAGLAPGDIGYLNLHGTGTAQNDAMEAKAVHGVLGEGVLCSSSKPVSGHTLGAAGALEAAFCWLALHREFSAGVPPHCFDGEYDEKLPPLRLHRGGGKAERPRYAMSNSFAFGGSNSTLIFGGEE